jgi:cytochrome c553
MRDAECDSCHVPNNPDKAKRLVLLQTPLHAASEIERLLKDVKQDRMPLDDSGIEKPLDAKLKERLLADAEAFAAEVKSARAWEASHPSKVKVSRQ